VENIQRLPRVWEFQWDLRRGHLSFVGAVSGTEKTGLRVPVAKERAAAVRDALLAGTSGIRNI